MYIRAMLTAYAGTGGGSRTSAIAASTATRARGHNVKILWTLLLFWFVVLLGVVTCARAAQSMHPSIGVYIEYDTMLQ